MTERILVYCNQDKMNFRYAYNHQKSHFNFSLFLLQAGNLPDQVIFIIRKEVLTWRSIKEILLADLPEKILWKTENDAQKNL